MTSIQSAQIVAFPASNLSTVDAYLQGLPSAATRRVYKHVVAAFDTFTGPTDLMAVTRRDVEAYRAHLEVGRRTPSTIAKVLSALSGFYAFAVEDGKINRNPVAMARRPKVPETSPRRALSPADVRALLNAADTSTLAGLRDRALLVSLALQAFRISEALGIRVEDLDEEDGHKVVTITGKGSKLARVPLAAPTWAAIQTFLTAAGITTGSVFVGVSKGDTVMRGEAISQQAAGCRIQQLAAKAGIARKVHPHLLRHTAVTETLKGGVALHLVQDFARHADPRTTRRYDSHRQSLANPAPHVLAAVLLD
jgi:integrase/recombinase XerD